ncbi:MAG: putative glycoside hydrolase, partial [Myxococcota bacterium]
GLIALGSSLAPQGTFADVPQRSARVIGQVASPPIDRLNDVVTEAGRRATGVYLPGVYIRRHTVEEIAELAERTHTNAVVIDMKDGAGRVTYATNIDILQEQVVRYIEDPHALLRALKERGVYTIARITCFADPQLPTAHPERAIKHIRRDEPWVSWGTGGTWLDPYNRDNHAMIVELAREAEGYGFDEIQLDYVRFPVDDGTQYARYPAEDGTERPALLIELLRNVDLAIAIPLGVDVFGLAAYREGDPSGLGQDLVAWREHVDVFSPMLYINAMRTWHLERPDRSRFLVESGVARLRERLGDGPVIRPYLQAFARGAGPEGFTPRFVARQIQGARRGGADGFLMWHPGARYSMFRRAMQGPGRRISPFPLRRQE